ncbi:hypothetical protein K4K49_001144 [Colletotrichum sp. SAR 10_70]|nr:hypothetical protein K4K50_007208 [Colletotrichum sp. SAR 10_71]KAI8181688.1 hypothetical protein K4K49_001144 [Colletotrichum sp. SAR 10_70]KAI8181941.1 hypothetical protein K4K51_001355 [Colletotrichum sp. SAR 10_75]KAI8193711.1 hypothetical protein KHU50_012349 [Colletotrichum sp. SAR 10_65]KAI8209815.1 hypothetical protein K4K52_013150 [Colletotrichum sp. SAR 10_76]KAI8232327.1 hypothetical protein K4K54_012053 [Colletotrichum sp. SAR 10_86]KAJ4996766.1 hypothetical protein K4K48_00791
MMRPAFQQVAAIPRRAMPTARQNAWEAVWRRQFTQRNTADGKPAQESLSLSQRLKKLSKEYGWSAVGVYLALSVLDFPFCFLLVRVVGTDRIGQLEHWVTSHIKQIIPESVKTWWHEYRAALTKAETQQLGSNDVSEAVEMAGWGVEEAQERNRAEASKFMHLVPLML